MFFKIKHFFSKYERYISPGALIFGFILDSLTLRRADLLAENLVIISYLIIASGGIFILNINNKHFKLSETAHFWIITSIQFAFGGLFSSFLVFYSRSTSFLASWPFILFILFNLLGNEIFKKRYSFFNFQISVLFVVLFSYLIFLVPILFKELSARVFILSGIFSLVIIFIFIKSIFYVSSESIEKHKRSILFSISGIFIFINILYFSNLIPPIPLVLKDQEIFHSLEKGSQGKYIVWEERASWKDFFTRKVFHKTNADDTAYFYSAVFSPTALNTTLVHNWQYFDKGMNKWRTAFLAPISIKGGREEGYRFYSYFQNPKEGLWRINVETSQGQIVGRIKFKVVSSNEGPELIQGLK